LAFFTSLRNSRRRCRIKSISDFGVAIPALDFYHGPRSPSPRRRDRAAVWPSRSFHPTARGTKHSQRRAACWPEFPDASAELGKPRELLHLAGTCLYWHTISRAAVRDLVSVNLNAAEAAPTRRLTEPIRQAHPVVRNRRAKPQRYSFLVTLIRTLRDSVFGLLSVPCISVV
jgi:hypothetical protein